MTCRRLRAGKSTVFAALFFAAPLAAMSPGDAPAIAVEASAPTIVVPESNDQQRVLNLAKCEVWVDLRAKKQNRQALRDDIATKLSEEEQAVHARLRKALKNEGWIIAARPFAFTAVARWEAVTVPSYELGCIAENIDTSTARES